MADAPAQKISITITPAMKHVLEQRVASGEFASASEIMREAFRLWLRQQEKHEQRLAAIRLSVQQFNENPAEMAETLRDLLKAIKTRKKR